MFEIYSGSCVFKLMIDISSEGYLNFPCHLSISYYIMDFRTDLLIYFFEGSRNLSSPSCFAFTHYFVYEIETVFFSMFFFVFSFPFPPADILYLFLSVYYNCILWLRRPPHYDFLFYLLIFVTDGLIHA